MIFMTVGSELPFNRMVRAVDEWALSTEGVEVVAQVGVLKEADYHPRHMTTKVRLTPDDYMRYCTGADFIIAHAGMGSIITALTIGKPIVIMPRREALRETRNDHQVATAKRFSGRTGIFVAATHEDITEQLQAAQAYARQSDMQAADAFAPQEFTDRIACFIAEA